ncbi:MAG: type II secretion system protein [Candidatus Pacebacteria bacterium]|nr:type II secretion system protein [Candidatus Paceibacterota bacterium]
MKKKQAGFSLLELLVVISIMGILIALGTVAFSTVQKKGRDSRRRADIKAMQDAFEQYRADNTGYEACTTMASYDSGSGPIMPGGLPTDPKNADTYIYNTSDGCDATGYCICAAMEGGIGNAEAATGTSCNFSSSGSYYCLTNLQ